MKIPILIFVALALGAAAFFVLVAGQRERDEFVAGLKAVVPPPTGTERSEPMKNRHWNRGDVITVDQWNAMVARAQCPEAEGVQGESMTPLITRFAACLAKRLN